MKNSVQRFTAFLLALLLIYTTIPLAAAETTGASKEKVRDGEYEVGFKILKFGESGDSYAMEYVESTTGKLIALDGNYKLQISLNGYDWFEYLGSLKLGGVRGDGPEAVTQYDEMTVLSKSPGTDIRGVDSKETIVEDFYSTVEMRIDDIKQKQDILMHINIKDYYIEGEPFVYDHWYMAQVEVDTTTLPFITDDGGNGGPETPEVDRDELAWQISIARAVYDTSQTGNYHGAYPGSARATLLGYINDANAVESNANATSEQIKQAYTSLLNALNHFKTLRIKINKANLLTSIEAGESLKQSLAGKFTVSSGLMDVGRIHSSAEGSFSFLDGMRTLYNDPLAEQAAIDTITEQANGLWQNISSKIYAASDTQLIVLDSLDAAAERSALSTYFDNTATLFQGSDPRQNANITINDLKSNILSLAYYRPNTNLLTPGNATSSQTPLVYSEDIKSNKYTVQIQLQITSLSNGIARFDYVHVNEPSVTKSVYLSFNGNLLNELNVNVEEAQTLYDLATTGNLSGQFTDTAIATLKDAIAAASLVGQQLSATKLKITDASAALSQAVDTFLSSERTTVSYTVAHATNGAFSSSDSYFGKPARVSEVTDTTYDAAITILNSSQVTNLEYKTENGDYVNAETLYVNETEDYRVVLLKGISFSSLLDARIHVVIPSRNYDQHHNVRFNFNGVDNATLSTEYNAAATKLRTAKAGTAPGEYSAEVISAFKSAVDTAGQVAVRLDGTQIITDGALLNLRQAVTTFNDAVIKPGPNNPDTGTPTPLYPADGQYHMNYRVLKHNTNENSVMNDYVVTSALVTVAGSTKTVSFTVKQSKEITGLTINGSSGTSSSNNTASNTRVVTFQLSDLSSKISGWVKIDWPEFKYHHEYDVQYQFDVNSARYVGANATVPGSNGHQGPPPGLEVPGTPGTEIDPDKEEETDTDNESEQPEGPIIPGNPSNPGTPVIPFKDTATSWAKNNIERAIQLGIASGYQDGNFRPNGTVTRAEFASFISRALKLPSSSAQPEFGDFNNTQAWAKPYIASVVDAGLINGYADQTFRAGHAITRAELAVIIARAAGLQTNAANAVLSFKDSADVPAWAAKAVAAAVEAGLIQGRNGNQFDPNGQATRAEALTMIMRLLDYKAKASSNQTNEQAA